MPVQDLPGFEQHGQSSDLIVILHAYMSSPEKLHAVRQVVVDTFVDADLYIPLLPAEWSSVADPVEIVAALLKNLDKLCMRSDQSVKYNNIIFIGHSLGALLARKLYVAACGEIRQAPLEHELHATTPRGWVSKVTRIILLAGMNRGWRISHHLSLTNAVVWTIGSLWGNLLWLFRRPPIIFTIRKGAPFITQLRIHWIQMRNHAEERKVGNALTIQLLGSVDDMVSPQDNIDLVSGRDFVYFDVPYSGHASIIDMNDGDPIPKSSSAESGSIKTKGQARAAVFRDALVMSDEDLKTRSVMPADLPPEKQANRVTDVIFVIHGIRDVGYWTHKVARRVLEIAKTHNINPKVIATETSSYGYFPMLSFFMPFKRREKVEWLMDQYAEVLARYPEAKCSFVGHSNGTYLLARAIKDYPVCTFKHVVFAGSVVPTKYNWTEAINNERVKRVLNYVATADWVVAFFPRAFEMLGLQDLGSAGHDGFKGFKKYSRATSEKDYGSQPCNEIGPVIGGHSAALHEGNWDAIAEFILTGKPQTPPEVLTGKPQALWVKLPSLIAPLIWVIIFVAVGCIFTLIGSLDMGGIGKAFLSFIFVWLIWKVVTVV